MRFDFPCTLGISIGLFRRFSQRSAVSGQSLLFVVNYCHSENSDRRLLYRYLRVSYILHDQQQLPATFCLSRDDQFTRISNCWKDILSSATTQQTLPTHERALFHSLGNAQQRFNCPRRSSRRTNVRFSPGLALDSDSWVLARH